MVMDPCRDFSLYHVDLFHTLHVDRISDHSRGLHMGPYRTGVQTALHIPILDMAWDSFYGVHLLHTHWLDSHFRKAVLQSEESLVPIPDISASYLFFPRPSFLSYALVEVRPAGIGSKEAGHVQRQLYRAHPTHHVVVRHGPTRVFGDLVLLTRTPCHCPTHSNLVPIGHQRAGHSAHESNCGA